MPPKCKFYVYTGEEKPATTAPDTFQVVVANGGKRARVVTKSYVVQKSSSTKVSAPPMVEEPLVSPNETLTQAAIDPSEGDDGTIPANTHEPPLKKVDTLSLTRRWTDKKIYRLRMPKSRCSSLI